AGEDGRDQSVESPALERGGNGGGGLMRRVVFFRGFDWLLLTFTMLIFLLGVAGSYSSTYGTKFATGEGTPRHLKQIRSVMGGRARHAALRQADLLDHGRRAADVFRQHFELPDPAGKRALVLRRFDPGPAGGRIVRQESPGG